jgi:hypothetical protein
VLDASGAVIGMLLAGDGRDGKQLPQGVALCAAATIAATASWTPAPG